MHFTGMRGMPRRVFTYAEGLGFDALNLVSTIGAFVLAAGIGVVAVDVVRPRRKQPWARRNPWNAGTLEWVQEMPGKPWGIRSIPEIDTRYPLWDQPNLLRDIDEGRFYLPDAEEGLRETIVTSVIDAKPQQCQRLSGPSFVPLVSAVTLGGFFIFGTYHRWTPAILSMIVATGFICWWLWTATGHRPAKELKDVGLGLKLPVYASGRSSVGWWGLFITLLADVTAFASLVFAYFFFWTSHADFPPAAAPGPGTPWIAGGAGAILAGWLLTIGADRANRRDAGWAFHAAVGGAIACVAAGAAALVMGPLSTGLDPTQHAYGAIVWLLLVWTVFHVAVGVVMHLYALLRRIAGRMTARHDMDIRNVVLYWHFTALTAAITALVVAGFPEVA
jgi:cytochrome c oxidase subunit I+III